MPAEVRLPQAGMGMTDGTVLDWFKHVGDEVTKGECLAEVEAAKTTLEIEAPCDGVLARIVTPAGTLVPVREVMAVIALPGETASEGGGAGTAEKPAAPPVVHRHDHGDLPGGATYTDVLARATILSLAEHPALNAHIVGDQIRIARRLHLGIGIDTGVALLVGVLRDADADGLAELSARRLALTERMRAGHADPAELQGSTFTITNLGHAGIDAFTPIINPPEVAILGAGRITDQPVPAPGGPGGSSRSGGPVSGGPGVAWRKSITLSLTADHRAVDGAPAARFLATLAGYLSKPTALS